MRRVVRVWRYLKSHGGWNSQGGLGFELGLGAGGSQGRLMQNRGGV